MKQSNTIASIALLLLAVIYMGMQGTWLSPSTSKLLCVIIYFLIAILIVIDRKSRGRLHSSSTRLLSFSHGHVAPHYFLSVLRWRGLAIGIGVILLALLPYRVILYLY